MIVKLRRAAVAVAVALCAPVVAIAGPSGTAGAAPTVTLSVTHGPPGTEITVSSPDCIVVDDSPRFLVAHLYSGTGADRRLAADGGQFLADASTPLIVPDWIDPATPATVEARCIDFGIDPPISDEDTGPIEIDPTSTDYEPVAFDVEPSTGPSVQTRTFSRTSLRAGQGFRVSSEGCTLPGATVAGDPSALDEDTGVSNSASGGGSSEADNAAVATRSPRDMARSLARGSSTRVTRSHGKATVHRTRSTALTNRSGRALTDDGFVDTSVSPDANGDWTFTDTAGFTNGVVEGSATCGDPFAEGFAYDSQIVRVQVGTPGVGPPILPGPPAPSPPPANAIPGNPNFTG